MTMSETCSATDAAGARFNEPVPLYLGRYRKLVVIELVGMIIGHETVRQ